MNKAVIIGNLARDPEMKTTPNGKNVCRFTVAVNRLTAKTAPAACDFIPCVCFDNIALVVSTYLKKGRKCAVSGRIQTRSYDAQDGSKRWATEIVAEDVEFLTPADKSDSAPEAQPEPEFDTEDLPF